MLAVGVVTWTCLCLAGVEVSVVFMSVSDGVWASGWGDDGWHDEFLLAKQTKGTCTRSLRGDVKAGARAEQTKDPCQGDCGAFA